MLLVRVYYKISTSFGSGSNFHVAFHLDMGPGSMVIIFQ